MVRIKYRYLLVNFFSPENEDEPPKSHGAASVPDSVALRCPSLDSLTPSMLMRTLREQIGKIFGDYGAGKTASSLKSMFFILYLSGFFKDSLRYVPCIVLYLSTATSTAIVRSSREHYRMVWAALTLMKYLPGMNKADQTSIPVVMQVVRVSGTIRKAEEEVIRRARAMIVRVQQLEKEAENGDTHLLDKMFLTSRHSGEIPCESYQNIESDEQSEEAE